MGERAVWRYIYPHKRCFITSSSRVYIVRYCQTVSFLVLLRLLCVFMPGYTFTFSLALTLVFCFEIAATIIVFACVSTSVSSCILKN
uniref:Uncharacterized protein n=1 Tax=Anopheles funestus TaxID=62324 RepID=A0A182S1T5_ANOFN